MHFLEHFYTKILQRDLSNKFFYKKTKKLPKITKVILNFGYKTTELKQLSAGLLALELITNQKGNLTRTKRSNIFLKIRKGHPVGCKVILRKTHIFDFFGKMINEIFPKIKNFDGLQFSQKNKKNVFQYELHDTFNFSKLEEYYYLFNNLPKLTITVVISSTIKEELIFILKSLQFPIKKSLTADITQLVEYNLAKVKVKGSNPFVCSLDKWSSGLRR